MSESTGPRVDRCDRVRGGGLALLVLAVVTSHGAVSCLCLHNLSVWRCQNGSHETERAEALSNSVGLYVAVVVLAGPDVAALPLHGRSDHVVDEAVLVGEACGVELLFELGLEDLFEDVLEATVVGLEDRVLRREVHGVVARKTVVKACASEVNDGGIEVVLDLSDSVAGGVVDLKLHGLRAVFGSELYGQLSLALEEEVGSAVLVTESVTADDDRLVPAGNQSRDVRDDDRLAEDNATKDVADGAVRTAPHLLEAEFFNAGFVGGDGCALDADTMLLDGVSRINGDLVVGCVTAFDAEVVVLEVDVDVGVDQGVLDPLPNNARHFVAVEFDDGAFYLDLGQALLLSLWPLPAYSFS